jgi:hypothetical protein
VETLFAGNISVEVTAGSGGETTLPSGQLATLPGVTNAPTSVLASFSSAPTGELFSLSSSTRQFGYQIQGIWNLWMLVTILFGSGLVMLA